MEFSRNELRDLTVAVVVLALAFAKFDISALPQMLFIIIAVFVTHEILGHKLLAQRYGAEAHFRMWPLGLGLALITGLLPGGFVFAAPGAVYISQYKKDFAFKIANLSTKEYGMVSLGGPLINIAIGFALTLANLFYPLDLFLTAASVSFFLALFNLIPIFPLDGSKIFSWDKRIWIISFAIALLGLFI